MREGLASPTPLDQTLVGNRAYEKYYAKLLNAENSAVKREVGMWKDTRPKLSLLQRLKQKLFG